MKLPGWSAIKSRMPRFLTEKSLKAREVAAAEEALAQAKDWYTVGEGNYLTAFNAFKSMMEGLAAGSTPTGSSFFDLFETMNTTTPVVPANKRGDSGYKDLAESDFTAVGLQPFQEAGIQQTYARMCLSARASTDQWATLPIARSLIENIRRYALGPGISLDCTVPDVLAVIRNFWKINDMDKVNKDLFRQALLEGEVPIIFFTEMDNRFEQENDPVCILRAIPATEIVDVEYDDNDKQTILSYKRTRVLDSGVTDDRRYLDVTHPEGDESALKLPQTLNLQQSQYTSEAQANEKMLWIKFGLPYDLRGRPILEPVLRWNRMYSDFVYDRGRLNHLRSKIFLIKNIGSTTGKASSKKQEVERMPRGGMMLVQPQGTEYKMLAPNTGASDAYTDIKIILYLIGSPYGMPIHILNVNAENENYASIRAAGNPFAQFIADIQDDWGWEIRRIVRFVLATAVRKKFLKPTYTVEAYSGASVSEAKRFISESIDSGHSVETIIAAAKTMLGEKKSIEVPTTQLDLDIIFPSILHDDPEKQAKTLQIYIQLKLMSRYTARTKIGVDPDIEQARIEQEYEEDQEKLDREFERMNRGNTGPNMNSGEPAPKPKPKKKPEEE